MISDGLQSIANDASLAAITLRQELKSDRRVTEGLEIVYPPTYNKEGSNDVIYNIVDLDEGGSNVCVIDSVQSQANRIEEAFLAAEWDAVVPRIRVVARKVAAHRLSKDGRRLAEALGILGDIEAETERTLDLLQLPHRIADATLRMARAKEEEGPEVHKAFTEFRRGNPEPMARLSPFSLLFGVWDSRLTQVKIPRAITGEILALNVQPRRKMAYFLAPISADDAPPIAEKVAKPSEVGFDNAGDVDKKPDGVLVRGAIVRELTLNLVALRDNCRGGSAVLSSYVLGLGLLSLAVPTRAMLRQGCTLLPKGETVWQLQRMNGTAERLTAPDLASCKAYAENAARDFFGDGGPTRREFIFDAERAALVFEKIEKAKSADKTRGKKGAGRTGSQE